MTIVSFCVYACVSFCTRLCQSFLCPLCARVCACACFTVFMCYLLIFVFQASKLGLEVKCREQAQLNQLTAEHTKTAKAGEVNSRPRLVENCHLVHTISSTQTAGRPIRPCNPPPTAPLAAGYIVGMDGCKRQEQTFKS